VNTENEWNWFASGKHSVARDYIRIGRADSVVNAITQWMDGGYRGSRPNHERHSDRHSWRFWIKGAKRHVIVCGVVKDSSDSIGRTYPFVLMGNGPVDQWTLFWDLLPLALENTWNRIEHISVQRFIDVQQVEEGIRILPLPLNDWRALHQRRLKRLKTAADSLTWDTNTCHWREVLKRETGRSRITVPLKETVIENQEAHVLSLLQQMKGLKQSIPTAVFIGGLPDVPQIVIFNRPLMQADFIHLWAEAARSDEPC
jgi:type VI secretion system protein VasJ